MLTGEDVDFLLGIVLIMSLFLIGFAGAAIIVAIGSKAMRWTTRKK